MSLVISADTKFTKIGVVLANRARKKHLLGWEGSLLIWLDATFTRMGSVLANRARYSIYWGWSVLIHWTYHKKNPAPNKVWFLTKSRKTSKNTYLTKRAQNGSLFKVFSWFLQKPYFVREAFKQKTVESVLIPRGVGPQASAHTSLGFFACSKPTCLVLGSPKTNFVFTPNSIFHVFSDLFDHLNPASHLLFIKFGSSFFRVVQPKILQNLFHSVPNKPNNQKKHCGKK